MKYSKLNLNDLVYFQLTAEGERFLAAHYEKNDHVSEEVTIFEVMRKKTVELEGKKGQVFYHLQMWEFINIFGGEFSNGGRQLIKDSSVFMKES